MSCTCGHPGLGCDCYPSYEQITERANRERRVKQEQKVGKKYVVERKVTCRLGGTSIPVGELRDLLAPFDPEVVVGIEHTKGYDQRDGDYVTLRFIGGNA